MPTVNKRVTINPPQPIYEAITRAAEVCGTRHVGTAALEMIRDHTALMKAELRRLRLTLDEVREAAKITQEYKDNGATVPLTTALTIWAAGEPGSPSVTLQKKLQAAGPSADHALRLALLTWIHDGGTNSVSGFQAAGISVDSKATR